MRFNTPFIWAYFAPVILINLVSYISVFHNQSSKIWTLEVGFYHSELSVQRTTIERTTGAIEISERKINELLREIFILSTTCIILLMTVYMSCTDLH